MSGGSFNYLCFAELEDLFSGARSDDMREMVDALCAAGAEDAAAETERLMALCEGQLVRIKARHERLAGLWQAMEWWQSCDTGEADWRAALEQWRMGG